MNKFKTIKKVSILSIIVNIFLLAIKTTISLITNSQSMLADALNSASDIFSSIMTYIGNKLSTIPPNEKYNVGQEKAEYIYSLLISITMGIISLSVLKNSFFNFTTKSNYIYSNLLIIGCLITITTKLTLYIYTNKLSKNYQNLLLETNSKDHLNDCLLTSMNLIGCLLSLKKVPYIDCTVGIIISLCILINAIQIFFKSYSNLMNKSINKETKTKIIDIILKHHQVYKLNNFISIPLGTNYQISFTIYLNPKLSIQQATKITQSLEKEIKSKLKEISIIIINIAPFTTIKKQK